MAEPAPQIIALHDLTSSDSSTATNSSGDSAESGETSLTTAPQSPTLFAQSGDLPEERLGVLDASPRDTSGSPVVVNGSGDDHPEPEALQRRWTTASSQLRDALQTGWKKILNKKLTFAQALFVFTINIVLLALQVIAVFTSNQPTSVDKESLKQETIATDMQKALLQKTTEGVKATNNTLDVSRELLLTEKQSLDAERELLAAEKAGLDDQKQILELAQWTAYHDYIKGCALYAVRAAVIFSYVVNEPL